MSTTRNPAHQNKSRQALPAGRRSRYERPSDVSALPEKFFNARVSLQTVCPETALMYAVLEDAFLCFHQQFELTIPDGQRRAQQAEDWFCSDDSRWLFSFVPVCHALGLEPEFLRKRLKQWSQAHLDRARGKL